MRAIPLVALVALLPSCSWVFQDRLKGAYDGRSEPQCSTSSGWPGLDLVFAGLNVLGGLAAGSDDELSKEEQDTYLAGGLIWGGIHIASAVTGFVAAGNCREAYGEWNRDAPAQQRVEDLAERKRLERELGESQAATPPPTSKPRGYFCASASSTGFCAREKADCIAARDAAVAAVPDMGECILVETAHCFDADGRERCFPIAELCEARAKGARCEERN